MIVRKRVDRGGGHSIEIGNSSWDSSEISIRNRYRTKNGGFSPRSSSELPIGDLEILIREAAVEDLFDRAAAARMIAALAASIARPLLQYLRLLAVMLHWPPRAVHGR